MYERYFQRAGATYFYLRMVFRTVQRAALRFHAAPNSDGLAVSELYRHLHSD